MGAGSSSTRAASSGNKPNNIEMYSKIEAGEAGATTEEDKQRSLSFFELLYVLRAYFWPDEGTDGAFVNRVRSSATWVMVALSKSCNLLNPYFLAAATNALTDGRYKEAAQYIILYCSFRALSSLFKELQSIIYMKVKQQANIQLTEKTFTHVHSLSLNWHLSKQMGNVIRSMDRGTAAADTLITYLFLYAIPAILECMAVTLVFLFKFKLWSLSVIAFSGVMVYIGSTITITYWRKKFREATNKHDNDYHDKATDSIINYETVKYFTAEKFEIERFKNSVVAYQKFSFASQYSVGILNFCQQATIAGTLLGTMLVAGKAVTQGRMNIGDFIAVNAYVVGMFQPLSFLGSIYGWVIQALVDIKNLSQLLTEPVEVTDIENAVPLPFMENKLSSGTGASSKTCKKCRRFWNTDNKETGVWRFCPFCGADSLEPVASIMNGLTDGNEAPASVGISAEFRNVSFRYPGQTGEKGLKKISFYVAPGTTTAIVGPSGAGKTTVARLLFRFYDPNSGTVKLDGHDISKYKQESVRGAIGIVPQDTVLFNDTILYNIQYGRRDASFEEVEAAAEAAQIKDFIESLEDGWNTKVGERGLKLSGGEKQRVAIARCLLKDPPVVFLDEATSALDTLTEHSIQGALNALGKHRTLLVIAHRLSTVKNADQIVVLDAGRIVERGNHEELLGKGGQYAELWNMQIRSAGGDSEESTDTRDLLDVSIATPDNNPEKYD